MKVTPKKKAENRGMSRESDAGWLALGANVPTKPLGKGRFDDHPPVGEAGPSRRGLQPPSTPQVGHKRAAVSSSKSPLKTPVKVSRQIQIQYKITQQDLQLLPLRVYLPSALMGAPRAFQTSRQSLALGAAEREHLDSEARAGTERYMCQGDVVGTLQEVLQQPVQPIRRTDELIVPRIRPDQLSVRNAGTPLRKQARVQNLQTFMNREQERKQQQPANLAAAVDDLTTSMAGQQPVLLPGITQSEGVTPPPAADPPQDTHMDTGATEKDQSPDDVLMNDGKGAQAQETDESKET